MCVMLHRLSERIAILVYEKTDLCSAIIALCIKVGLAIAVPSITKENVLIIVLPTVLVVDV